MPSASDLDRRVLLGGGLGVGLAAGAAVAAPAPARLNIVSGASTVQMTMAELMRRQGYLGQFGLDVKLTHVSDGARLMASLLSGEEDVCIISGLGQIFPAVQRGAKMKIIAGANTVVALAVYSAKPDVRTLKDLEGRTVGSGAPGSLLYDVMVAAMAKQGVDYTKVKFVNIGSNADVFRAVAGGVVDAGPSTTDVYYDQAKYGVHAIADLWTAIPDYPYQGAYATDAAIAKKRDAIVRLLAAYARLYRFIMSPQSKKAWVDAYVAAVGHSQKQAEDLWRFNIESQSYDVNLTIPDKSLEYLQNLNLQTGGQSRAVPLDQVRDMSLAQDALKLIGGPIKTRPVSV
jgi:ABC-type nitrate/sulfonate/bicarbonate transport system substrate-binding protein